MIYTKLHPLAQTEIERLKRSGIDLNIDSIIWLHELAKRTDVIGDPCLYQFISKKVAGIEFYPLTYGSKLWLVDAKNRYSQNPKIFNLLELYAFTHSRNKDAFDFECERKERNAIVSWAKDIYLSEYEVKEVIREIEGIMDTEITAEKLLLDLVEKIKEDPTHIDLSKIQEKIYDDGKFTNNFPCVYVATLMHFYGKTEEEWMWNTPVEVGISLINKIPMFNNQNVQDDNSIQAYRMLKSAVSLLKVRYGKG